MCQEREGNGEFGCPHGTEGKRSRNAQGDPDGDRLGRNRDQSTHPGTSRGRQRNLETLDKSLPEVEDQRGDRPGR